VFAMVFGDRQARPTSVCYIVKDIEDFASDCRDCYSWTITVEGVEDLASSFFGTVQKLRNRGNIGF
jgi:hypothetical protein